MKVNEVTTVDEMSVGAGGVAYENSVLNAVRQASKKYKGYVSELDSTAGYSNVGVDLAIEVAGKNFAVEIKQDRYAQMGGTSMIYNFETDEVSLTDPSDVDDGIKPLFVDITRSKKNDFIKFIKRLKQLTPQPLKQKMPTNLPIGQVWVEAWDQAKKEGLLKKLNGKIYLDNTDVIAKRYNRKGVYYIQIGDAGLFYLISNPLKLPVPKFEGEIEIELRMGRGGSKGKPRAGSGYRVQGRLKTEIKSPLSLDNPSDVATVFQTIIDGGGKPAKTTAKAADKKVDTKPVSKPVTVAEPTADTKTVKTKSKVDLKQKAKMALATGGKSNKG